MPVIVASAVSADQAPLAQLVEQLTLNQRVGGSKPSRRTSTGALQRGATISNRRARAVPDATSADPAGPRAAAGTTVHEPAGAARPTRATGRPGRALPRFG